MSKQISFSAGCFHFALRKEVPLSITGKEYVDSLKRALGEIDNLNNLVVNVSDGFLDRRFKISKPLKYFGGEGSYFPGTPNTLDFSFDLYIPSRVQDEINPIPEFSNRTGTENFKVYISYRHFHMPVAFVLPVNPSEGSNSSDCVVIVREFLEKEFSRNKGEIKFECLGPSPFHARFFISPQPKLANNLWDSNVALVHGSPRAYPSISFHYLADSESEIDEIRGLIFRKLGSELSLYYQITKLQNVKSDKWVEFDENFKKLLFEYRGGGLRAWWFRLIHASNKIQDVLIEQTDFEFFQFAAQNHVRHHFQSLKATSTEVALEKFFVELLDDQVSFPGALQRELISLLENRRAHFVEGLVALVAAVVGGAIGSLLTILATGQ